MLASLPELKKERKFSCTSFRKKKFENRKLLNFKRESTCSHIQGPHHQLTPIDRHQSRSSNQNVFARASILLRASCHNYGLLLIFSHVPDTSSPVLRKILTRNILPTKLPSENST